MLIWFVGLFLPQWWRSWKRTHFVNLCLIFLLYQNNNNNIYFDVKFSVYYFWGICILHVNLLLLRLASLSINFIIKNEYIAVYTYHFKSPHFSIGPGNCRKQERLPSFFLFLENRDHTYIVLFFCFKILIRWKTGINGHM